MMILPAVPAANLASAITYTDLAQVFNATNDASSYSATNQGIGPANRSDKYLIVIVSLQGTDATAKNATAVTVDGVSLTKIDSAVSADAANPYMEVTMWGGFVNTANTTGTIAVTASGTCSRCAAYRGYLLGATNYIISDLSGTGWNASATGFASSSYSVDGVTEVAVFGAAYSTALNAPTWTNATSHLATTQESAFYFTCASRTAALVASTSSYSHPSSNRRHCFVGMKFAGA